MTDRDSPETEYFIDVTPVIYDPFGCPNRFGVTRYKATAQQIGSGLCEGEYRMSVSQGIALSGYPNGALSPYVVFEVKISLAGVPQPIPISELSLIPYPGLEGRTT